MTHIYKDIGDNSFNRHVQTWHISTRRSEIIVLIVMYKHDTYLQGDRRSLSLSWCTNMTHIYKELEVIVLITMYKHDTSTGRSEIVGLIQGTLIGDTYILVLTYALPLLYMIHPVMVCMCSWRIRATCRFHWYMHWLWAISIWGFHKLVQRNMSQSMPKLYLRMRGITLK